MSTAVRVYRLGLGDPPPPPSDVAVRVYRAGLTGAAAPAAGNVAVRVYRAGLTSPVPEAVPVIQPIPNQAVEAGTLVSLDAVDSVTTGRIAQRSWVQATGPAVQLVGSGASRTFVAPVLTSDTVLSFRYTATNGAGVPTSVTVLITVWKALIVQGSTGYVMRQVSPLPATQPPPVLTAPGAPTVTDIIVGPLSAPTITVNWNPPAATGGTPITGYVVKLNGQPFTLPATARTYQWANLVAGAPYAVTVAAVNAVAAGSAANAQITIPPDPSSDPSEFGLGPFGTGSFGR